MDHSDNPTATHPHSCEHHLLRLLWREKKSHFLAFAAISHPTVSVNDHAMIHISTLHRTYNNSSNTSLQLTMKMSCEPCDWIPSCASISPVYQQRGQPGKSKCSLLSLVQEAGAKLNAKQQRTAQLLGHVQENRDKLHSLLGVSTSRLICDICLIVALICFKCIKQNCKIVARGWCQGKRSW